MTIRHEYYLDLSELAPSVAPSNGAEIQLRALQLSDAPTLAELMIDAYRGTIDYDDETIEDAIGEVNAYLGGERGGAALLEVSQLAFKEAILISACLVAEWDKRQQPIIAYVMTRAKSKNQGLAKQLLISALRQLDSKGHGGVWAVITEGNLVSEQMFINLGFRKVSV